MEKSEKYYYGNYDFLEFPIEKETFYKDSGVKSYLKEISKYKRLSEEKEKELLQRISMGDKDAKLEFFHANLKLAVFVAKKYSWFSKSVLPMDLIQEANLGLLDAIDCFDFYSGNKFSTYAVPIMKYRIIKTLKNEGKMLSIPEDDLKKMANINKIENTLMVDYERERIFPEEIYAELYGYTLWDTSSDKEFMTLLNSRNNVLSLDEIDEDLSGSYDVEEILEENLLKWQQKKVLIDAILSTNFDETELYILHYLFLSSNPITISELAKKLNMSHQVVSNMKKRIILKIKNTICKKRLYKFDSDVEYVKYK